MTGRLGTVLLTERVTKGDGTPAVEVRVQVLDDDDAETAELLLPPNVDSLPLPGDEVVLEDSEGSGSSTATGFADAKNAGKAAGGEYRAVGRDPSTGAEVVEVWCKGDGSFEVNPLVPAYKIKLGKVEIDELGNITTPGEITGMAGSPATSVTLSKHLHPTGVGPSGKPQPGT